MQGHKTVHWFQDILSLHCPIFYIIRWNSIFCANTSATGDNATSKTHSPHSVWCCNVSIYLTWHKNPGQLQANCQPDICRTHRWKYMWPYFTKYIWVTLVMSCHFWVSCSILKLHQQWNLTDDIISWLSPRSWLLHIHIASSWPIWESNLAPVVYQAKRTSLPGVLPNNWWSGSLVDEIATASTGDLNP